MKNFIKDMLIHTIKTLISGAILFFIISISFIAWDSYKDGRILEPARKFKEVERVNDTNDLSHDLEITDLVRLEDFENFTIRGKIKNISEKTYFSFYVNLEYKVEKIKMGECHRYFGENTSVKPGESLGFLIECSDFSPKTLPSQFDYTVNVRSASRYKIITNIRKTTLMTMDLK